MMLPRIVYQMCVHGALLAGSAAKALAGHLDNGNPIVPGDFDLLVPHDKWQTIALLIPNDAVPNKFGGWRFITDHKDTRIEVDVWPGTLQQYLSECKSRHGDGVVVVDFIHNRKYTSDFLDC